MDLIRDLEKNWWETTIVIDGEAYAIDSIGSHIYLSDSFSWTRNQAIRLSRIRDGKCATATVEYPIERGGDG